jgi:hypothetical protein
MTAEQMRHFPWCFRPQPGDSDETIKSYIEALDAGIETSNACPGCDRMPFVERCYGCPVLQIIERDHHRSRITGKR